MSRIEILKKLDHLAGPFAVSLARLIPPRRKAEKNPERILFIRPGGIGDAVLLIPAVMEIRKAFPAAAVHILAEKRNHEIFSLCPGIDRVCCYDRFSDLLRALSGRYDAVIDTEQWYRLSAVIARLTRAPIRIGFATNERRALFNWLVAYDQSRRETESFLDLASALTRQKAVPPDAPWLEIPESIADRISPLAKKLSAGNIVALFPGGSVAEKKWPVERFRELSLMLGGTGRGIVVLGGREDAAAGDRILEGMQNTLNMAGKLSLAETAALLKTVGLLITNDSGIMHIAASAGTATLSIFGPGNEKKWAPEGERHAVICRDFPCRPCSRYGSIPVCSVGIKCLREISTEEAFKKAMELLEAGK